MHLVQMQHHNPHPLIEPSVKIRYRIPGMSQDFLGQVPGGKVEQDNLVGILRTMYFAPDIQATHLPVGSYTSTHQGRILVRTPDGSCLSVGGLEACEISTEALRVFKENGIRRIQIRV